MSNFAHLNTAIKAAGWRFNAALGAFYNQVGERVSYRKLLALVPGTTEDEFAAWSQDLSEKHRAAMRTEAMPTNVIYKITYPNGKIYVGQDGIDSINYFGSPNKELIAKDFPREQRQMFTVTREILWESETATPTDVDQKETELILALRANDPAIGYNQSPNFK